MGNKNKYNVLVIGELNMDLILDRLNGFPQLGKEKLAEQCTRTLGSSSAIFASNIARLGIETAFCGLAGKDDFGNAIVEELQQNQVQTQFIQRSKQHQTGLTAVIRHHGDRAMITHPGAMRHFSLQHIPDKAFQNAGHLHLSSIFLQPGIKENLFNIIDKARAQNMSVSVDTQWDPEEQWDINLQKLLPKIDFFLPNDTEFLNMTAASTVKSGLEQLKNSAQNCTIVVTCGKEGAMYLHDGSVNLIAGHTHAGIVDTVGAGDSFNAGLIYRYLQDDDIKRCAKFGAVTGAVSTTQAGGTAAIQSMEAVKYIAKNKLGIKIEKQA